MGGRAAGGKVWPKAGPERLRNTGDIGGGRRGPGGGGGRVGGTIGGGRG